MESRLEYLFNSYIKQNCSAEEEEELMELLAQSDSKGEVQILLNKLFENEDLATKMPGEAAASILKNILEKDKFSAPVKREKTVLSTWTRVAAAATVLLFMSVVAYWVLSKNNNKKKSIVSAVAPAKPIKKVLPGGNHAILTMADGSRIVLDSVQNGKLHSGSATISKQGGLLVYDGSSPLKSAKVTFNTLTTPRGGQYKVVLEDGSEVWLNASSSLHFPTAFSEKERDVDLTGEAYFEIAKNKEKPFHVNVNGYQVEVLGTHFDVNAYADEGVIKTSLLEGSVKIKMGNISGLLKPGQQGVLKKNTNNIEIKNADMNLVVAWKNGLFQFDGADIKTIMRQIGRWYDVEIEYSGEVPEKRFEGKISRDAQLSDVLKILELSNVKFTVKGKKIIVE
jgi:ferric-dicitrate binding protein FerR (iron transport regulator)